MAEKLADMTDEQRRELKERMINAGLFWWVAYRPSGTNGEWKLQGEHGQEPYRTYQTAHEAMRDLINTAWVDVMLLPCVKSITQ